jgi:hypothetical protein
MLPVQFQVCSDLKVLFIGSWLIVDKICMKISLVMHLLVQKAEKLGLLVTMLQEMTLMNYLVSADTCSGMAVYHIY